MIDIARFPLPPAVLPWLLSAQILILVLHRSYLSITLWALVIIFIAWRWLIGRGHLSYPNKIVKTTAVLISIALLATSIRGFNLESAGSFLIVTSLLKLIELRNLRDGYIAVFLNFFVLATGFLFAQDILSALLAILIIHLLLVSLTRMHYTSEVNVSSRAALAKVSQLMLLSLPMMLVLYLLFPRIGPLWSFSLQSGQAQTGLSDTMAAADIAEMTQSSELAFRASFKDDQLPARSDLYWRALVLDYYDGRHWKMRHQGATNWDKKRDLPSGIEYEIIQEPTSKNWLFALNNPYAIEQRTGVTADDRLVSRRPVFQRMRYRVHSALSTVDASLKVLPKHEQNLYLQLPKDRNPRATAWAESMKNRPAVEVANEIMQTFAQDEFYYTLKPQRYGDNEVDEFLFDRKLGFCSHYASAMAFLARSAGIPARVVTGYQGGEWNDQEKFLTVRQYDAHAWVELWVDELGWQSFDPTVMVAEDRILYGLEHAMAEEGTFLQGQINLHKLQQIGWLNKIRVWSDTAEYIWQKWVLSYDDERQSNFLQNVLKLKDYQQGLYIIAASFVLFFMFASAWLWWRMRPESQPPLVLAWSKLQQQGKKKGIQAKVGETLAQYLLRLQTHHPQLAQEATKVIELVDSHLYKPAADNSGDEKLISAIKQLTKQLKKIK